MMAQYLCVKESHPDSIRLSGRAAADAVGILPEEVDEAILGG